ncbi:MAG: alanine--tRNA ligase [Phycisphaerae bacterium]|nr:alanine--tRNA ligase [Phycisphaerae bacterium]MDW8261349.1 alanine--tRNA ligase [Phycisphaerales bacterium]
MLSSCEIRRQFIDYFVQKHGHTFVPSSPVVPQDDPTLLFTNAGMNQFKPLFLGQEKRSYTRAVNTQKCIRAGGKHNDLDDVGRSRRHHTFFEMLGNWSFGDYFKAEAIEWAWDLLVNVWKLDPARLHVTCFEGDDENGIPRDTEAAELWSRLCGVPSDHIHFFGKDNFWEMGDTGPCGPCTEIHIDRTSDKSGRLLVGGDDPRVMEIWNLVFIQYNRNPDRSLTPLPARHVDTGMGFERICQVLQDVHSNYDIDLWHPFWERLSELSGRAYRGTFPKSNAPDPLAEAADAQLRTDIAFRVIADHIRCLTFAITDGATPSNEGRGYVLRRILRRAVRFGRQTLELKEPFLHRLVDVVVQSMGESFPELRSSSGRVVELIREEEVSFGRALDRGIELFDAAAKSALADGRTVISAGDAFKLHDTYGFPVDLTQQMALERGMTVDIAGYERLMEEARQKARAGLRAGDSPVQQLPPAILAELQQNGIGPTDDSHKFSDPDESLDARVLAIWNGSSLQPSADASDAREIAVILDRTCFYAEMGGQVGDRGQLASTHSNFNVETTRAVGGYVLHIGRVVIGTLHQGDPVRCILAEERRRIMQNHTATHLLNWALREVLGDDVQQKGSLVAPDRLRFDFSHGRPLGDGEIARIEGLSNEAVRRDLPVHAGEAPLDEALKINGLRAVFGEKYPQRVRVVSIGTAVEELLKAPGDARWRQFSIELCGGTHVARSGQVGAIVLTSEESVSKGVRRVVALSGDAAASALAAGRTLEKGLEDAVAASDDELNAVVSTLQKQATVESLPLTVRRKVQATLAELHEKLKRLEKTRKSASQAFNATEVAGQLLSKAADCGVSKLIVEEVPGASEEQLRSVLDSIRKRQPGVAAILACTDGVKVSFVAAVTDDLITKGLKAGDWVREAAKATGGGGGGRPQMAQAGGKDPSKLPAALSAARAYALSILQQS